MKNETKPKATAAGVPVYCAHDAIVRAADLKPNPKNPNKHPDEQIERLGAVIRGNGWRNPITVSTRSGLVVKGHGRLLAAIHEGLDEVPVDFQTYESEAAELADLTADNKIAELSETDERMLAEIFADIDTSGIDFERTGYSSDEYDEIAAAFSEAVDNELAADPDDVPLAPVKPVTQRGDVWILGRHRLICGDATNKDDVAELMNGDSAALVFTDPPYGINAVDKNGRISSGKMCKPGQYAQIIGDNSTETAQKAYEIIAELSEKQIIWGGNYFVNFLPFSDGWIVWDKREGTCRNDFSDGEMAWCSFHTPLRIYYQLWNGMIKKGESGKRLHPTQKPVKMLSEILADFSSKDDIVVDLFAGSGSTLIACEKTGRTCYASELDEHYADVIVQRYIKTAGGGIVQLKRNGTIVPPSEYKGIFDIKESTD